jgi:predicted PurR-regulated permease PerM
MNRTQAENYIFLAAIALVAVLVVLVFLPELNVIALGITFAVLFSPLHQWLLKMMPRWENLSALLIVLLSIIIILGPFVFFGFQLFSEAQGFYTSIASGASFPVVQYLGAYLQKISPSLGLNLNFYLQQAAGIFVNNIGKIFSEIVSVIITFFLSLFALFYFLKDGKRFYATVLKRSPFSHEHTEALVEKLHMVMASIIRGSLVGAAIYGIVIGLGFFIFGIPSAILWGAVGAIAAFVPMIGVWMVVIPGALWLLALGSFPQAIGLLVWMVLVSIVIENFLRPWLVGRKAGIHPLLVLFSVLGGLAFFGPIGLLLGPLALGLFLALLEISPLLATE